MDEYDRIAPIFWQRRDGFVDFLLQFPPGENLRRARATVRTNQSFPELFFFLVVSNQFAEQSERARAQIFGLCHVSFDPV
jgi:hypothetical protein